MRSSAKQTRDRLGVDGIMTNDVTQLTAVLREEDIDRHVRLARREDSPFQSRFPYLPRFIANRHSRELHDLDNEVAGGFDLADGADVDGVALERFDEGLFELGGAGGVEDLKKPGGGAADIVAARGDNPEERLAGACGAS